MPGCADGEEWSAVAFAYRQLEPFQDTASHKKVLLIIHGTFSNWKR